MRFANPEALLVLPAVALGLIYALRAPRQGAARLSSLRLAASLPTGWAVIGPALLLTLRWLALTALVFALARPQTLDRRENTRTDGIAIQLILDISASMETRDYFDGSVALSRLQAVKHAVRLFVEGGQEGLSGRPNDKIGIIAFARDPDVVCPLTHDRTAILEALVGWLDAENSRSRPQESEPRETTKEERGARSESADKVQQGASQSIEKARSSKQAQQQQSQEHSEGCSTCQTGQNRSAKGRQTNEGGDGSQTGRGTRPSSGLTPSDRVDESEAMPMSSDASSGDKRQREGRSQGPEPDASKLFHAETSGLNRNRPTSERKDSEPRQVGLGTKKSDRMMDPMVRAAVLRLQESIRRIEDHRRDHGGSASSDPEDPANMNRYRDW